MPRGVVFLSTDPGLTGSEPRRSDLPREPQVSAPTVGSLPLERTDVVPHRPAPTVSVNGSPQECG
jgi:hypothetical protein